MNAYLWGAATSVSILAACVQGAVDSSATTAQGHRTSETHSSAPAQGLRLIVQFSAPAPVQDEALLQSLQDQTLARVRYLSSLSNDTHVYLFQPAPGQTQAQLLQRLGAMPSVVRTEIDLKTKLH